MALCATVVAFIPGPAWSAGVEQPLTGATLRFEPSEASGGTGLTVAGTGTFRGALEVRRNGRGLAVVNHLSLEEYVRGIDEVPPSWPAAALQAQAIAARTYAAHKALAGEARWRELGADICATSTCQVYRGLDAEKRATGHGWLRAVEDTAGRALLEGGRPIMASYSSTANGPRAMSQNGALEMARAGRSATDILAAYYGLRPTLAPAALPATIKVAIEMNSTSVRISSPGPFRVVDGTGAVVVTAAAGDWAVTAAAAGVRLVPPENWAPAPAVSVPAAAAAFRSAGRVMTAAGPVPAPASGRWTLAGGALTLVITASTITLQRRRRA